MYVFGQNLFSECGCLFDIIELQALFFTSQRPSLCRVTSVILSLQLQGRSCKVCALSNVVGQE